MAIDEDDEILQDFLVEAGEILEQLNEQLIILEQSADDSDLLNAVFRGFHTIKGGAGFLNLTSLVELCHRAEDVFNALRNGERAVDAQLMDVILPVLDVLNSQFDDLRDGQEPSSAEPGLLLQLEALLQDDVKAPVEDKKSVEPKNASTDKPDNNAEGDVVDEEFEAMLVSAENPPSGSDNKTTDSDVVSDDEFEALLDEIHGKPEKKAEPSTPEVLATKVSSSSSSDEMTDEDFEALLDELHGQKSTKNKAKETVSVTEKTPVVKVTPRKAPAGKNESARKVSSKETTSKPRAETTVRVDTKRLDNIMNMVGELVLVRNRLSTLQSSIVNEEVSAAISNLDVVTSDLQLSVMKTRMQPIKKVFGRFPRVVRDLARNLNKQVDLEMHGEDTDLDKNLVEALSDPLVHLVRNAIDHGVEIPEIREAAGKPPEGKVTLTAAQEGDHILLTIEDDGAGMDADVLRKIAIEKGIHDEESAARLGDHDCYNLIFEPGFSTKTEISDISGRGVGMDVVKTRIVQLNGTVDIDSTKGKGSRISIKLPLTLAILPTLMIKLADRVYALPLVCVNEIFNLSETRLSTVDGKPVVVVRDKAVPLFYLRDWLVNGSASDVNDGTEHIVIVTIGNQKVGFVVDYLVGQEEVVIKPLGNMLQGTPGMAGATITGDGKIALILDVPELLRAHA